MAMPVSAACPTASEKKAKTLDHHQHPQSAQQRPEQAASEQGVDDEAVLQHRRQIARRNAGLDDEV